MARTLRDEITYPCPHFEGCIVEVLVWISNLLRHFMIGVVCYVFCLMFSLICVGING